MSSAPDDRSATSVDALDVRALIGGIGERPDGGPRLIGIDGPSGSGKSTLTRRILRELGDQATELRVDDFLSWDGLADWWWPRFELDVLRPLLAGQDVRYQIRDWQGDEFGRSLGPWRSAHARPYVVMEGVTCTRTAVADRIDCALWIEAAAPERLRRGLERDGESHRHLWEAWMPREAAFFAADQTRARADVVLSSD